jgi:hypothetical protein
MVLNATSSGTPFTSSSTYSPASGSNQIMFVVVAGSNGALPEPSSAAFGSQTMTRLSTNSNTGGNAAEFFVYYLTPTGGTFSSTPAVFNFTAGWHNAGVNSIMAFTFSGVSQSKPFGQTVGQTDDNNNGVLTTFTAPVAIAPTVPSTSTLLEIGYIYCANCSSPLNFSTGAVFTLNDGTPEWYQATAFPAQLAYGYWLPPLATTTVNFNWSYSSYANYTYTDSAEATIELLAAGPVGSPTSTPSATPYISPTQTTTQTPYISPTPSRTWTLTPVYSPTQTQTTAPNTATFTISPTFTVTSTTAPGAGNSPTPTPTLSGTPIYQGLATGMQPYGLEYVPFPVTTLAGSTFSALECTFTSSAAMSPVNTARWRIVFTGLTATVGSQIALETRIGPDGMSCTTGVYDPNFYTYASALSLPNKPQNFSSTYFWDSKSNSVVPYTERFDAMGDPRMLPYADLLDNYTGTGASFQGNYNWYFRKYSQATTTASFNYGSNTGDGGSLYDNSVTFGDSAQDSYYNAFLPSCYGPYNTSSPSNCPGPNFDVPKLYALLRTGLLASNCVFSSVAGYSNYYAGVGAEIGGNNDNDFYGGVLMAAAPWNATSTAQVDNIIGNWAGNDWPSNKGVTNYCTTFYAAITNSSGTATWYSKPFLGELWPDSLYASNWEGYTSVNNGGNTTWGNLANPSNGGQAILCQTSLLPSSSSPVFQTAIHMMQVQGSAGFMNGNNSSNYFGHDGSTTFKATAINDGVEMGTDYNFALPAQFANVTRQWGLNMGTTAPFEYSLAPYSNTHTHLDVYTADSAAPSSGGFYDSSSDTSTSPVNAGTTANQRGSASVRMVPQNAYTAPISGANAGAWFVISGLAPSTQSGISFIGEFGLIACLRTFQEAGVPTSANAPAFGSFSNAANTYSSKTYRIPPVPLVTISHPTTSDPLAGYHTINIWWDERYARWDGGLYTENYPCVDANIGGCTSANPLPTPTNEWHDAQQLGYNIIYSIPTSVSPTAWYSALTGNIVPAGPGNNWVAGGQGQYMPGSDAILSGGVSPYETSSHCFQFAWSNVPFNGYDLEVECFRLASPTATVAYPHYCYHKIYFSNVP